jgi:hypothetical protein
MSGERSLYRACRNPSSSVDLIRRLIDEDPKALTKQDSRGETPLHSACVYHRDSPEILHCLLDRCPPEVIGIRINDNRFTPFHLACIHGVSIDVIKRMIFIYSKALRMLTKYGQAPLHMACYSDRSPLEVIRYLVNECPIVCLLNNSDGRTPYHESVAARFGRPAAILNFLLEATKQAALALVVFVDCSVRVTVSPIVVDHIHRVIPNFAHDCMSSNEPIRQALDDPQTLNDFLTNTDLQEMLKDEDFQDVVCGMHRIIKASSLVESIRRFNWNPSITFPFWSQSRMPPIVSTFICGIILLFAAARLERPQQ